MTLAFNSFILYSDTIQEFLEGAYSEEGVWLLFTSQEEHLILPLENSDWIFQWWSMRKYIWKHK